MLHAYMAKPEKMFYFIETSVALVLAFIHKKYQLNKYLCCTWQTKIANILTNPEKRKICIS